jgi:hypothetical protein
MSNQLFHPCVGLGGAKEIVNEAVIIPLFRNSDPTTSKKAGKSVAQRSPSQREILLKAYSGGVGYTDEEAGVVTGLIHKPRCCYWKRCSELRAMGYIVPTGDYAKSTAGELQMICCITAAGERHLRTLDN